MNDASTRFAADQTGAATLLPRDESDARVAELAESVVELNAWATEEGLRGAMKAHAGHDIASGLLRTYLGNDAGSRVHSGAVERGTVESLFSVLWYADLRGFTRISDVSSGAEIVHMLNDVFETLTARAAATRRPCPQIYRRCDAGDDIFR